MMYAEHGHLASYPSHIAQAAYSLHTTLESTLVRQGAKKNRIYGNNPSRND